MLQTCLRPRILRSEIHNVRLYSGRIKNLQYPDPPTKEHNDRLSFLDYAARVELDPASTVYNGTLYEYTTQQSFRRLGMNLQRSGGAFDNGIDLVGTWSIPQFRRPLKVIVSCKLQGKTTQTGPRLVRELEGAFVGAPIGWRERGVIGILVTPKAATKGMRQALGRSRWPMGFAMCSTDGAITQLLWNQVASVTGLEDLGVGVRYSGQNPPSTEVAMLYKGEPVVFKKRRKAADPVLRKPGETSSESPE